MENMLFLYVGSTNRQTYQTGKIIRPLHTNDLMSLLSRHLVKQPKVMLAVIIKHRFKTGEKYKVNLKWTNSRDDYESFEHFECMCLCVNSKGAPKR